MKIAIFVSYIPPHVGGIEVVALNQTKALAAMGNEVTLVTSACDSKPGIKTYAGYKIRRISAWNYFEEKMDAVFPVFAPSILWHSYSAVKKSDIVHVHDAFYLTSFFGAFWAKLLHKPLILTQHVEMVAHPNAFVRAAEKVVYATSGKFIIKSSSKIIVLNSRVRHFIMNMKISNSKILFIPNGVDTNIFSETTESKKQIIRQFYNLPADKTLALFVGRFVPKKGFTKLIGLKSIDNLAFVMVGGNAPEASNRKDQYFFGKIDRAHIPDIFKACDMFVLPSEGEGFPVTIQEAMACGLPVITTDDPGYEPYRFNHNKMLFINSLEEQNIFNAVSELQKNLPKQKQMSKYSRDYAVTKFDWPTSIHKLLAVYKKELI